MNLEPIKQSEVSHKEKNKYCILLLVCGIQKNGTDELNGKAQRHRCGEQTYRYQGGSRGGMNWEIGIDIDTLYIK